MQYSRPQFALESAAARIGESDVDHHTRFTRLRPATVRRRSGRATRAARTVIGIGRSRMPTRFARTRAIAAMPRYAAEFLRVRPAATHEDHRPPNLARPSPSLRQRLRGRKTADTAGSESRFACARQAPPLQCRPPSAASPSRPRHGQAFAIRLVAPRHSSAVIGLRVPAASVPTDDSTMPLTRGSNRHRTSPPMPLAQGAYHDFRHSELAQSDRSQRDMTNRILEVRRSPSHRPCPV